MKNIQNVLLTEKYRPQSLDDLITPKRVGEKLSKGVYQHLLLHGSPGTGKTSAAKALVKHFKHPYLYINASTDTSVDVVRNRILSDSPSCYCPRCLPNKDKKDAFIIPTAFLGFMGLFLLIIRYWEMCLTLPFAAIAYFCFSGSVGLRFTVHVGNAASM